MKGTLRTTILLGLALLGATPALCNYYAEPEEKEEATYRLAIPAFIVPTSIVESVGRYSSDLTQAYMREQMADLLTERIKEESPDVVLLERRELDQALNELGLDESGLMETDGAVRLGKMKKANFIVIGTVSSISIGDVPENRRSVMEYGKDVKETVVTISARLVNVETAEIIVTQNVSGRERLGVISSDARNIKSFSDTVIKAANYAATEIEKTFRPFFNPLVEAKAISKDTTDIILQKGKAHGLKKGELFRIYGIKSRDKATGFEDREFLGTVEVVEVQAQACRCKFKSEPTMHPTKFKNGLKAIPIALDKD
ncbi:MAG: hypothetical protein JST40_08895 [Armatimonadetes bacterium]|nr:hypothetical protein [Armatimonadota bacterium]